MILQQYYRRARQMALQKTHPELMTEDTMAQKIKYPRPISEPPSPSTSKATTPASSPVPSDDEQEEEEKKILNNRDVE